MPAHKSLPLRTKHGTTPNTSPPCSEMEGLCPQPASEDSGHCVLLKLIPAPLLSVFMPRDAPNFPNKFFSTMWHHIGRHKTWACTAPWTLVKFCECFGSRTGFCRVVWEELRAAQPCDGWQGSAAAGNVPGCGKQTTILDAGKISWQSCPASTRQDSLPF